LEPFSFVYCTFELLVIGVVSATPVGWRGCIGLDLGPANSLI